MAFNGDWLVRDRSFVSVIDYPDVRNTTTSEEQEIIYGKYHSAVAMFPSIEVKEVVRLWSLCTSTSQYNASDSSDSRPIIEANSLNMTCESFPSLAFQSLNGKAGIENATNPLSKIGMHISSASFHFTMTQLSVILAVLVNSFALLSLMAFRPLVSQHI